MVSHGNIIANLEMIRLCMSNPAGATSVSWVPLYHDMGLMMGVMQPLYLGGLSVLLAPAAFMRRPLNWLQEIHANRAALTSSPNFAFDLATRKTSDEDMAGLDLGGVHTIQSGAERVQPATIKRFTDRFARFNLNEAVIQPSYGMAEATLYMATPRPEDPIKVVHFDTEALTAGHAKRSDAADGTPLISYDGPVSPRSPVLRIVDADEP